jgi:hypothetical protein
MQTFQENILYLQEEWSEKEVIKFIQQTEKIIGRLKRFPFSYPPGYNNKKYPVDNLALSRPVKNRTDI